MAWSGQSQQDCSKACQWQPFNHCNYKGRFTHAISFSEGESWSQIWISFWFPASMWHLLFTTLVLPLENDWWEHTPLRNQSKTVWARWSRSNSKWTWFDCSEKTIKLWINQTAESEPNKPVCFWLQEAFLLDTSCYTEPWGANWAKGQNCSFPEMPYVLDMWTDKQYKTSFFLYIIVDWFNERRLCVLSAWVIFRDFYPQFAKACFSIGVILINE